ncbi:hypothetical protein [Desulfogranum japonicum]|uniref:hypothetical protein n=1 Tax=Desulfogranum japonicum TaxID=231447 RepID=UPI000423BAD0|nr:hypothetical protein [Desulfogranum japonicum]
MAARKTQPAKKKTTKNSGKPFSFQLGWSGLAGVVVVTLCLFLWMFFLGVWAGQTILFPSSGVKKVTSVQSVRDSVSSTNVGTVKPRDRKRPVKSDHE